MDATHSTRYYKGTDETRLEDRCWNDEQVKQGEEVALSILLRICEYLDCDIGDICEAVRY